MASYTTKITSTRTTYLVLGLQTMLGDGRLRMLGTCFQKQLCTHLQNDQYHSVSTDQKKKTKITRNKKTQTNYWSGRSCHSPPQHCQLWIRDTICTTFSKPEPIVLQFALLFPQVQCGEIMSGCGEIILTKSRFQLERPIQAGPIQLQTSEK